MRCSSVILLAGLLGACGSTPGFCDQFSDVFTAQENAIGVCVGDGGDATAAYTILSTEFPFSIQACSKQLPLCDSADVQQLNTTLKCVKALPTFDCNWLDETDGGETDDGGGLAAFQAAVQGCEAPTITPTCQGGVDSGLGCGTETHAANNDPTRPLPLNLGLPITDCLGTTDTHYLSITAPSGSKAGGYFTMEIEPITQDVLGQIIVQLADPLGNLLNNARYEVSTKSGIFLAAAQNAEFLIELSSDSGNIPLAYTITVNFTAINDPYKPDPTLAGAQMIDAGEPTLGSYCWAGQVNATALTPGAGGQFDDWFSVDMPGPGTATVVLQNFPGDFIPEADFVDATGTTIEPESCKGCTGNHTNFFNIPLYYKAQVTGLGTYFVHVFPYQVNHQTYANYSMSPLQELPVLPAHFTTPYSLTVSFGTP